MGRVLVVVLIECVVEWYLDIGYVVIVLLLFMILQVLVRTCKAWISGKIIAARHDMGKKPTHRVGGQFAGLRTKYRYNISVSRYNQDICHYKDCHDFSVLLCWSRCLCYIGITICPVGEVGRDYCDRVYVGSIYPTVYAPGATWQSWARDHLHALTLLFDLQIDCQFWDFIMSAGDFWG